MPTQASQESLVGRQFGAQALAYLNSPVHAQGPDLAALTALAATRPGGRLLDLGCGGGHVALNAAAHVGEVVAYDLSPEMLAVVEGAARERGIANLLTRQGVVEALPFADGEFDIVFSRFSAHHWSNHPRALAEAQRVLRPGGIAAFVDTTAPEKPLFDTFFQTIELLRDCSHVRNYSADQWLGSLRAAGFETGEVSHYRLHIDFASWIERMRTPEIQVAAIRALQASAAQSVRDYFEIEPDGSFTIDVALFRAAKAG